MTTLQDAARQALEVLQVLAEDAEEECGEETCPDCRAWRPVWATITALRAALEQPERAQKMRDAGFTRRPTIREMSEQPEQEDEMQKMLRSLGFDDQCPESIGITLRRWKDGYAAALEQPERAQAMRDAGYTRRPTLREMSEEEPEQEPVACPHRDEPRGCYRVRCQLGRKCVEPLFTHPPRREWRGLTYQEIDDLQSGMQATFKDICAIEAALKEKNHE